MPTKRESNTSTRSRLLKREKHQFNTNKLKFITIKTIIQLLIAVLSSPGEDIMTIRAVFWPNKKITAVAIPRTVSRLTVIGQRYQPIRERASVE